MKKYFELMRINHYIKNLLIFCPLFFSGKMFDIILFGRALSCFISFSLLCSAIYVINDILDIDVDRKHVIKKNRPIASGAVAETKAVSLAIILIITSFAGSYWYFRDVIQIVYMLIFLGLNIVYSLILKQKAIWDVVLLCVGYPLRVLLGGYVCEIHVSSWLFLTVICISLYLAFGKRYGEYIAQVKDSDPNIMDFASRPVLKEYTKDFLQINMYLNMSMGVLFYSLWAIEKDERYVFSVPLVIFICLKYNLLIEVGNEGDPISTLLKNRIIQILVLLFIFVMILCLYYF